MFTGAELLSPSTPSDASLLLYPDFSCFKEQKRGTGRGRDSNFYDCWQQASKSPSYPVLRLERALGSQVANGLEVSRVELLGLGSKGEKTSSYSLQAGLLQSPPPLPSSHTWGCPVQMLNNLVCAPRVNKKNLNSTDRA